MVKSECTKQIKSGSFIKEKQIVDERPSKRSTCDDLPASPPATRASTKTRLEVVMVALPGHHDYWTTC